MSGTAVSDVSVTVVIPVFNNAGTIGPLLDSVMAQTVLPQEIIVVDDGSADATAVIAQGYRNVRVIRLERNSGPSVARNCGARAAAGDLLLFLDSDVVLPAGAVETVKRVFAERPELHAVNGVMEKEPLNSGRCARYKALIEYGWGQNVPAWDESSRCLNARIGAVRRCSFLEIGGFNEGYRKPSVEDHEFGMRFTRKHRIAVCRELTAFHHFSGFPETCRNYFKRSSELLQLQWLAADHAVLDNGGASSRTRQEFITGFLLLCSLTLVFTRFWPVCCGLFALFVVMTARSLRPHLRFGGVSLYCFSLLLHLLYGSVVVIAGGVTFVSFRLLGQRSIPDVLE